MQFIKVTQHNGATTLYINPQHILLIDTLIRGGAMLSYMNGQYTNVDQSVEEILTLINQ
jgi:uncharacterized protein YlzI (FlbEa/FlbD family)